MSHARLLFLLASTFTFAFASLGCGGGSAHGTTGAGGSGTGGSGAGGSGGSGEASTKGGVISMIQNPMSSDGAPPFYSLTAGFYDLAHTGTAHCTPTASGACSMIVCTDLTVGGPSPAAGTITVTVGGKDTVITPGADGAYTTGSMSGQLWAGPDVAVTGKASGGEVPAFTLDTKSAGLLAPTSPNFDMIDPVDIDTSKEFTMVWSGKSPGQVRMSLYNLAVPPVTTSTSVTCTFEASAGSGTIPASVMAQMEKGQGEIEAYSVGIAQTNDDGWDVSLLAGYPMVQGGVNLK